METSKYDTAKMAVKSSHSSLFQCLRLAYKDSCKTKTVYLQKLLKYFKELQRISQHGKLNFVTFPTANFENSLTLHWVGRRDFSAGKADRLRVRRPRAISRQQQTFLLVTAFTAYTPAGLVGGGGQRSHLSIG